MRNQVFCFNKLRTVFHFRQECKKGNSVPYLCKVFLCCDEQYAVTIRHNSSTSGALCEVIWKTEFRLIRQLQLVSLTFGLISCLEFKIAKFLLGHDEYWTGCERRGQLYSLVVNISDRGLKSRLHYFHMNIVITNAGLTGFMYSKWFKQSEKSKNGWKREITNILFDIFPLLLLFSM